MEIARIAMTHLEERHRGAIGDLRWFEQPGIETFPRFVRGNLPPPAVFRLTFTSAELTALPLFSTLPAGDLG
jgi:hypothetical protein